MRSIQQVFRNNRVELFRPLIRCIPLCEEKMVLWTWWRFLEFLETTEPVEPILPICLN